MTVNGFKFHPTANGMRTSQQGSAEKLKGLHHLQHEAGHP